MKVADTKFGKEHWVYDAESLIRHYKRLHPESHYFDSETLKFFGERISEMYLYSDTENVTDWDGNKVDAYCLKIRQRKAPVGVSQIKYAYFSVDDLSEVIR